MALTPARRARLEKLAAYLEGLPKNYRHFSMRAFLDPTNPEAVANYALHNGGVASCGTVACAIGHGPAAGILVPPRLMSHSWLYGTDQPDWHAYGRLFAGADFCSAFDWSFGASWHNCDDTHYGAAARIRYLLEHRRPPNGYTRPALKWRELYAPYRIDAKATA